MRSAAAAAEPRYGYFGHGYYGMDMVMDTMATTMDKLHDFS